MEQNDKPSQNNILLLQILLGFAATVIAAYLGYQGVLATIETPIHATQTAEARVTAISPSATTIIVATETPILENTAPVVTETPMFVPATLIAHPTTSGLIISLPMLQELSSIPNIWDLVNENNPTSPTTLTYSTSVLTNSKYKWGAIWCGKNAQTLQAILRPLTMTLLVNGQVVDGGKILEFDEINSGWSCHRWTTIISGWQSNTTTKLELSYFLSETIYDGAGYTQMGEYHLIILATAQ
jgi:hypothetical protein